MPDYKKKTIVLSPILLSSFVEVHGHIRNRSDSSVIKKYLIFLTLSNYISDYIKKASTVLEHSPDLNRIIIVVIIMWTVKFDFMLMLEHDIRGIHTKIV